MVSTVSAKTLTTAIGAMTGGMISDDDGFGTILGLATGAAVGYNFTVIKPRISDIYTHSSALNIERPMTDLERLREKMLRRVDRMDIVDTTDEEVGTLDRYKKDSFYWYKKVIATNGEDLSDDFDVE